MDFKTIFLWPEKKWKNKNMKKSKTFTTFDYLKTEFEEDFEKESSENLNKKRKTFKSKKLSRGQISGPQDFVHVIHWPSTGQEKNSWSVTNV